MKKISVILSVLLAVTLFAFAVGATATSIIANGDDSFDVIYEGVTRGRYIIIAIEGITNECPDIANVASSAQYFDQQTADDKGVVSFKNIVLKESGKPCSVFVGGSGLDKPVFIGYIGNGEDKVVVSGTIKSSSSSEATVTFVSTTDENKIYTANTSANSYEIELPADTYKIVITKPAHLSYVDSLLEINEDSTVDATLKGGDLNNDNVIDFNDFSEVLKCYSTNSKDADINGDGVVDFNDFSEVLKNYTSSSNK